MIGRTLGGYRLVEQIGAGGMATVYKAYDPHTSRDVAVKVLHEHYTRNPKFLKRFRREAKAIAILEHIHILPVHAYGEEDGLAYLAMRYVRTGTLKDRIQDGPLPLDEASRLLAQIASALDHAHEHDILHRDVKPANVLLDADDNAYLTDFGLSKIVAETTDLTGEDMLGTPQYMSPEQCQSRKDLCPSTDVYALGAVLYEMVTGVPPFQGESPVAIVLQQINELPPLPSALRPDLPAEAERAIFKALDKDPLARYQSAGALAAAFAQALTEPPADVPCPYKGLATFEPQDAPYFFGRKALVAQLTARLAKTPFLAVVGPSGSGKSSLVRAGLLPALGQEALPGSQYWQTVLLTPGGQPLEELAIQFSLLSELPPGTLLQDLERDYRGLNLAVKRVLAQRSSRAHLLLIVDQFEELFTLCQDEAARGHFIAALLHTIEAADSRAILMPVLRADFYGHCAAYPELAARLQESQVLVPPLSEEELYEVIEQPAAQVGLRLEPGLVETIVREVAGEPGALPLLSHALLETWQRRRGRTLILSGYVACGGVQRAIARTAETVLQGLTPQGRAIARTIFTRLTELGSGDAPPTRRRATLVELVPRPEDAPAVEAVLRTLANARLVTSGKDTVEVAHEALIRHWPTLRRWLDEDREGLRLHRHLTEAAQEWQARDRDPGELYRGARLAAASEWAETHADELNPLEREFLDAGRALQASEIELERKRAAQLRRRAFQLGGALILALMLGVIALFLGLRARRSAQVAESERDQAQQQARVALSRQLAAQALAHRDGQLDLALLLSLEAGRVTNTLEARASLLEGLQRSPHLITFLHGHSQWVNSVAYSPDGKTLASGSADGTIILWDVATGQPIGLPLAKHQDVIWSVALSPDGQTLASGSADRTIILWNVATGQPIGPPLTGHTDWVLSVAFSPDGQRLASGGRDHTVILWDVASGQPLSPPLQGHTDWVWSVAFSRVDGGQTLASGSADHTVRLWDVSTGQSLDPPLTEHTGAVWSVAFNTDSFTLASGGSDGTVLLWDAVLRQPLGPPLTQSVAEVLSLAFSPDGQTLAAGHSDGDIILWEVTTRQPLGPPLVGHADSVRDVAFSPDGQTLASGGRDRHVLLWQVAPDDAGDITVRQPLGKRLAGHLDDVLSVAFSPDGQTLASGGLDHTVLLWDLRTSPPTIQPLPGHSGRVWSVAFSPDGQTLASGSCANPDADTGSCHQGEIRLWDVATGQPRGRPLTGHSDWVNSVAFAGHSPAAPSGSGPPGQVSSDGHSLASGSRDSTVILWLLPQTSGPAGDVAAGKVEKQLSAHTDSVLSIVYSPDGQTLASGSRDTTAILWDVATGAVQSQLTGHEAPVWSVAFSPNGQTLATAGEDGTVILWSLGAGEGGEVTLQRTLRGHSGAVWAMAFNPECTSWPWQSTAEAAGRSGEAPTGQCSQTLASSSADGTIVLWDVAAGSAQGTLTVPAGWAWSLAFSPDGQTLAAGNLDDTITLWDVSPASWQARACRIANRNLTADEWELYLGEEPYRVTCPELP